jgi:hypothetical protein
MEQNKMEQNKMEDWGFYVDIENNTDNNNVNELQHIKKKYIQLYHNQQIQIKYEPNYIFIIIMTALLTYLIFFVLE